MANRDIIKTFSLILTLIIVILGIILSYWTYTFVNKNLVSSKKKVTQVEIDTELYQKISEPGSYGTSVSTVEEGYGRDNPFAPYKALPSAAESTGATAEVTPTQ
jgi:ABC-type antimicrobial peptide transport system permease subunit